MRYALAVSFGVLLALAACGGQSPFEPTPAPQATAPVPTTPVVATSSTPQVFAGAGDIADCGPGAAATARLLDQIGGQVFALGDIAYPHGTAEEFQNCYAPAWGRLIGRTRPVPGNHDYDTSRGAPYYSYFGAAAGPAGLGYYSFDLGAWHVVALNSNIAMDRASAQLQWLRSDLAAHPGVCTLAMWHHPLFSSGGYGGTGATRELWQTLYGAGADVILNGHEHLYERFARQDPDGEQDGDRGIRQFTVGTGGAEVRPRVTYWWNSELVLSTYGVLKLTLRPRSYDWEFISASGGAADAGSEACH